MGPLSSDLSRVEDQPLLLPPPGWSTAPWQSSADSILSTYNNYHSYPLLSQSSSHLSLLSLLLRTTNLQSTRLVYLTAISTASANHAETKYESSESVSSKTRTQLEPQLTSSIPYIRRSQLLRFYLHQRYSSSNKPIIDFTFAVSHLRDSSSTCMPHE